jgi:hypothetical protein
MDFAMTDAVERFSLALSTKHLYGSVYSRTNDTYRVVVKGTQSSFCNLAMVKLRETSIHLEGDAQRATLVDRCSEPIEWRMR